MGDSPEEMDHPEETEMMDRLDLRETEDNRVWMASDSSSRDSATNSTQIAMLFSNGRSLKFWKTKTSSEKFTKFIIKLTPSSIQSILSSLAIATSSEFSHHPASTCCNSMQSNPGSFVFPGM